MLLNGARIALLGLLAAALTLRCGGQTEPSAAFTEADASTHGRAEDSGVDLGPQGEHYVVKPTCDEQRFSQQFRIEPGFVCTQESGTLKYTCVPKASCTHPDQCVERPFGRCIGIGAAQCSYPNAGSICTSDADCTAMPSGACRSDFEGAIVCYPPAECQRDQARCIYPAQSVLCETDAQCDAAPGGFCNRVVYTECRYDDCRGDEGCLTGQRCACNRNNYHSCVPSECTTDLDCATGQHCIRAKDCGSGQYGGYYCTTASDECRSDDDCGSAMTRRYCDFSTELRRWACIGEECPVD